MAIRIEIELDEHGTVRNLRQVNKELKKTGGAGKQATTGVKGLAGSFGQLKTMLGAAGVLGGLYAFQRVVKGAVVDLAKFNAGMVKFNTIARVSQRELSAISVEARQTAVELGVMPVAFTEAMYQAVSAGIAIEDSIKATAQASKLATAGFTDQTTAIDLLTTVSNAYGEAAGDLINVSDVLLQTQNLGKTTIGELGATMGQAIPTAAALGTSFTTLSAMMASLTANGINTAEAVTSVRSAMIALATPSKLSRQLYKDLRIEWSETRLQGAGIIKLMKEIIDKTGGSVEKITALGINQRALNAVLTLGGKAYEDVIEKLKELNAAAGTTEESFALMTDTLVRKWAELRTSWTGFVISLVGGEDAYKALLEGSAEYLKEQTRIRDQAIELRVLLGDKPVGLATEALVKLTQPPGIGVFQPLSPSLEQLQRLEELKNKIEGLKVSLPRFKDTQALKELMEIRQTEVRGFEVEIPAPEITVEKSDIRGQIKNILELDISGIIQEVFETEELQLRSIMPILFNRLLEKPREDLNIELPVRFQVKEQERLKFDMPDIKRPAGIESIKAEADKVKIEQDQKGLLAIQKEYALSEIALIQDTEKQKIAVIQAWYDKQKELLKGNEEALKVLSQTRELKIEAVDITGMGKIFKEDKEKLDKLAGNWDEYWGKVNSLRQQASESERRLAKDDYDKQREFLQNSFETEYGMLTENNAIKIAARELLKSQINEIDQEEVDETDRIKKAADQRAAADLKAGLRDQQMAMMNFANFWGNMWNSATAQSGNVLENFASQFEDVMARMAASAALAGIFNLMTGGVGGFAGGATTFIGKAFNIAGFDEGGYTGNADISKIAGVVHGKEYVIDAPTVQHFGPGFFKSLQDEAHGGSALSGYQLGGYAGGTIPWNAPVFETPLPSSQTMITQSRGGETQNIHNEKTEINLTIQMQPGENLTEMDVYQLADKINEADRMRLINK